jgi:D-alanyl-D-alanine carboxypeptidase/D-alanyl-D-alanine-endopeptidase (penicillin-binding protein 4)
MKRIYFLTALLSGWLLFINHSTAPAAQIRQLKPRIDKLINSASLKQAQTAIEVFSISRNEVLYAYHPNDALIPASNMKLITTAAALTHLGPDYRFATMIAADPPPRQGVVEGDLYIKGFGDPFLVYEEMWKLTHHLAMKGLKRVKGDIVADDTFFDEQRWGTGWQIKGNRWYEAQIGALSFNFNTIEVNVEPGGQPGSPLTAWLNPTTSYVKLVNKGRTATKVSKRLRVTQVPEGKQHQIVVSGNLTPNAKTRTVWRTIRNPALYTATVFRDYLQQEEIKIEGRVRQAQMPQNAHKYYIHYSKPLALIIRGLNKMSNNFTAEQILKTLGAEIKGPPGTAKKGLEIVEDFLKKSGVDLKRLTLVDGSGLSRDNRLSPHAINRVLVHMYNDFSLRAEYMASLAVAGVDGTLNGRFNNTNAIGKIRAKTGRIRGVAALSGYIFTKQGELLAFSMLMNNFRTSTEQVQKIQDKICLELVNFERER